MRSNMWIVCVIALLGCKKEPQPSTPKVGEPTVAAKPAEAKAPADPAPPDDVIDAWLAAQNQGDLETYLALYDASFTGIRRNDPFADNDAVTLDLQKWTAERKKMFSGAPMKVEIENRAVARQEDGTFTFTFIQRFQRGKFADHGQKAITVAIVDGTPKIVREEMRWSRHSWNDDPADPVDATAMVGPFTLRLSSIIGTQNGDCFDHDLVLHVVDAAGRDRSVSLGQIMDTWPEEGEIEPRPGAESAVKPSRSKKALYSEGGGTCGGLTVSIRVVKNGDRIEAVEDWEDPESPRGAGTYRRLAVLLPPGAEVKAK